MLFSWYFLRVKISDKDEIKEQNIIQLYDTQNIFFEASTVIKMSLFNLFKSKHSNFGITDYNKYSKNEEFVTDVLSFYEGFSSHIEVVNLKCKLKYIWIGTALLILSLIIISKKYYKYKLTN